MAICLSTPTPVGAFRPLYATQFRPTHWDMSVRSYFSLPLSFLVAGAGTSQRHLTSLYLLKLEPGYYTFLCSPLPVLLPDLVAPQPVSALIQPTASTIHNPTSRQNRSIKDWADTSRYPAKNPVTVDRGFTRQPQLRQGLQQPAPIQGWVAMAVMGHHYLPAVRVKGT